jgi:hypothetical protein
MCTARILFRIQKEPYLSHHPRGQLRIALPPARDRRVSELPLELGELLAELLPPVLVPSQDRVPHELLGLGVEDEPDVDEAALLVVVQRVVPPLGLGLVVLPLLGHPPCEPLVGLELLGDEAVPVLVLVQEELGEVGLPQVLGLAVAALDLPKVLVVLGLPNESLID